MAKELGQIHTVNYALQNIQSGDRGIMDLPGQLSEQLQHRVRMLSTFKVVGIDMAITGSAGSLTGVIKYFAPTKGRVESLKQAWKACKDMLDLNGVKYWNNLNYDFRPIFSNPANYTLNGALGSEFLNQASLESVAGAPGSLCLIDGPAGYKTVFDTYNEGIQPAQTAVVAFSSGFQTIETGTAGDMVLNEGEYINSWLPQAEVEPEVIPWSLGIDFVSPATDATTSATTWMWRPDPALYLAVLTGQLEIECTGSSAGAEGNMDLSVGVMVAGWKGVLHHRKKSRRHHRKAKTHGSRRRRTTRKK